MNSEYNTVLNNVDFYKYVHVEKELRDASLKASEEFDKFNIENGLREDLYNAVKRFVDTNPSYETAEQ